MHDITRMFAIEKRILTIEGRCLNFTGMGSFPAKMLTPFNR